MKEGNYKFSRRDIMKYALGSALFAGGVGDGVLVCHKTKIAQQEVAAKIFKNEQREVNEGIYKDLTVEERTSKIKLEFNDRMAEKAPSTGRLLLDLITELAGGGLVISKAREIAHRHERLRASTAQR